MSRAQERSTGLQSGSAQGTSGNVTGTSGNVTGATSTSLHDQPVTRTETSYARGTETSSNRQSGGSANTGGGLGLGGLVAMLAGLLTFFAGLAAVIRRVNFTVPGYAYRLNVHAWGWILLVLGVLLFAAGASHLLRIPFARVVAAGLALLTAIAAFMFVRYTPLWGTILVALSALALFSLARPGEGDGEGRGRGSGGARYSEGSMGSGSISSGTTTTGTTTGTTSSRSRI